MLKCQQKHDLPGKDKNGSVDDPPTFGITGLVKSMQSRLWFLFMLIMLVLITVRSDFQGPLVRMKVIFTVRL